ncbi:hypothetical protein [Microbacterium excoecariae]|uniref:hypothetical protein n=1 Tax=Microbacterium excoecariae TaxID=2715210 RepID=UPI001408BD59|nr:hypothetical protein [Microbacterium excoecariae]NHI17911.1 hypothetical protein [Microbacterium excoecariae]
MSEIDDLRARIAALESENTALKSPRRAGRGRSILATILITAAVLTAPLAVVASWTRAQLVDTGRFVATLAPLADSPAVQDAIADEISAAIDAQVDIEGIVSDAADGLRSLDLPPRADTALVLVEGFAARGISSLVDDAVHGAVASDAFSDAWAGTLRLTHTEAVAAITGDETGALAIDDSGVVSLQLGVVIDRATEALSESGFALADQIPSIDQEIPLVQADELLLVRAVYLLAVAAGLWLPWVALGLLVAGVLVARDRRRTTGRAGFALAVVFALLGAGLAVGRHLVTAALSPATLPAGATHDIFDQLTATITGTVWALALAGALIALVTWFSAPAGSGARVRGSVDAVAGSVRAARDRHGLSTGRFGAVVDRYHAPILLAAALGAGALVFFTRPLTTGVVVAAIAALAAVALVVELVRRSADAEDPAEDPAPAAAEDAPLEAAPAAR